MKTVRIDKLSLSAEGENPAEARRLARRIAELLGEGLAGGDAVVPSRRLVVEVPAEGGASAERLARMVVEQLKRRLG